MLAIGDLQGCLASLETLLDRADDRPESTRLVFVGDLVNRGPQSLATLRFVRALDTAAPGRVTALLGNHDLHLLAVEAGVRRAHRNDTLGEILAAPDRGPLIDWLRARPLAHFEAGALFVHAGVLPSWTVEQTLALAGEVQARLTAPDYRDFLVTMYGNEPARWRKRLRGADRLRCIVNALTRLRFVATDGTMEFSGKGGPDAAPAGFLPWFDHPARATRATAVVFGHWSTLGKLDRADAVCLDTGCVWGGQLSALRWPSRQWIQVACPPAWIPGQD